MMQLEFVWEQPSVPMDFKAWRPISSDTWNRCRDFSNTLDLKKKSYKSSKYWNPDAHFIGTIAESLVGVLIGSHPNLDIQSAGDGGHDFKGTDVKASTFIYDPELKITPKEFKGNDFVLVVVDLKRRRARVAGWANEEMVRNGEKKDYGHGERYVLTEKELRPGLPSRLMEK